MSSNEGEPATPTTQVNDGDPSLGVRSIGLAMSGGGYRATAWGLGAAMAIADLGAVPTDTATGRSNGAVANIKAISSVSGGSIANSWLGIGASGAPLDADRLDAAARELLPKLVGRPRWWRAGLFCLLAVSIISPWLLRQPIPDDGVRYLATSGAAVLLATAVGVRAGDLLFGWWAAWLYFGILTAGLVGVGWILFLPRGTPSRFALAAAALVVVGALAQFRPYVVQGALARQFAKLGSTRRPLAAELGGSTQHIICITELAGNNLVYAGSGLIYSSNFGLATVAPLTAASATQASANFPGGFPIRWLPSSGLALAAPAGRSPGKRPPRYLAVTDGGAYDNMGSHWFVNLPSRRATIAESFPDASDIEALEIPDLICVANASGLSGITNPILGAVPIIGEILGLLRVKTVLYEQTTAPRRRELVDRFEDPADPLNGVLSHIATSPRQVLERAGHTELAAVLDAQDPTLDWAARARDNAAVPTALWPLGDAIIDLVHHAYVITAVHLYLYNGMPLRLPPRSEFQRLAADGEARPRSEYWHPSPAAAAAAGAGSATEGDV